MKSYLKHGLFWSTFIFLLYISTNCFSQQAPEITAEVGRESLKSDEFLQLIIKVKRYNNSFPAVDLSSVKNFRVVQESREHNIQRNKQYILRCDTFLYLLAPTKTGKLNLGPIKITCNGRKQTVGIFNVTVFKKHLFSRAAKNCPKKKVIESKPERLNVKK